MTTRRSLYFAVVVLAIACTNLWPVSASGPELVKLSTESLGVQQCIQPKDEYSQDERSKLRIRFTLTNVSDQPLIIYSRAPSAFDLRIVRREIDFAKVPFKYEQRPTFNCPPPLKFETINPGDDFQILQPNESLTHEPAALEFFDTTSVERKRRLEGDYFVKLRVATWYWDVWKAEILEQRWSGAGRLFYSELETEPIAITIPKPGATTPRCDTVLLK
jgi:hypothetical protein